MFEGFFYTLRAQGLAVSPTSFLQLQRALQEGLVESLDDFYVVARTIMVKKTRHFDLYDRVFAHVFKGRSLDHAGIRALSRELEESLREWLADPHFLESLPEADRERLEEMSPEEVVQYFLDRLAEQTEEHHGGNRWIGTGGTSPVGHSGVHPGGMRVGGRSRHQSAIKVAMERRYIDYAADTLLSSRQLGEALRAVRNIAPVGPRDQLNIDESIRATVRNGGEIDLVFDRRLKDKLNVLLFIDNGGWSMMPYVERTRALFNHARDTFRKLHTYYFHNCIYDRIWEDPQRYDKPVDLDQVLRQEPDTRILVMGDASMAPYELMHQHGAIDYAASFYQRRSGLACLQALRDRFPHAVWINPVRRTRWTGRYTIGQVRTLFPMVDLTLAGIEEAARILAR